MQLADAAILRGLEGGLLYTALGVFTGASVVGLRVVGGTRRGRALRSMVAVGTVLLTLGLVVAAGRWGRLPLVSRSEVLLFVAWGVAMLLWAVDRRAHSPVLVAAVAPSLALLIGFSIVLLPGSGAVPAGVRTAATYLHIVLAIAGCAAFTFAAATGALYLWQIRTLKRRPAAAVGGRVPALETLDRLNFRFAASGVVLLGLSLVVGWAFIPGRGQSPWAWFLDPTVLAVCVGLLVYGTLFTTRTWLGWRGRRAAWLTVVGFVVVVIVGGAVAAFCPKAVHLS
ncbi:MAG: cytochrome c biogenesis protein CcsA [Planctomycetota bacterium]